jgi:hypothetical protein
VIYERCPGTAYLWRRGLGKGRIQNLWLARCYLDGRSRGTALDHTMIAEAEPVGAVAPCRQMRAAQCPMRDLPLNIWLVIEQRSPGARLKLVSIHATQGEAGAERDKRNRGQRKTRFASCILEPVAQRI